MTDELYNIIQQCANLRGIGPLHHRTIEEFSWFCDTIVFEDYEKFDIDDPLSVPLEKWKEWRAVPGWDALKFAKQFSEYCTIVYGKLAEEELKELEKLVQK